MTRTAVGAPAPSPSNEEILARFAEMTIPEFLIFQAQLRERLKRMKFLS
jgi:hypothetical protein